MLFYQRRKPSPLPLLLLFVRLLHASKKLWRKAGVIVTYSILQKHNRWTEGLISAAKSVAASTNVLIETADGVLSKQNSPEQLIVASNEVAASTAQLVAASRVKSSYMSKTQDHLELASKNVTSACKSLVAQVQDIISKQQRQADADKDVDYSKLTPHVLKRTEMEQQVEILKLENMLGNARKDWVKLENSAT